MTIYRDQLEAVYQLIEKPEHWTVNDSAKDSMGHGTDPCGDHACRWCLDGAFARCGIDPLKSEKALGLPKHTTPEFNDAHTHADVLALLKSAIDRAPVRPS